MPSSPPRPPGSAPQPVAKRIATALLAERRRIAMAFRAADATRPDQAATLAALGLRHDAPFDELLRLGVIQQVERGYWFDDTRYEHKVENPRFRTVGMLVVLAIFVLLLVAMVGVFTA